MRITALVENQSNCDLKPTHGLSLYIETQKHKLLFDLGPDRTLFENARKKGIRLEDVDTVVEPDVMVVCDASKVDDRGVKGAPDLIVEVLSPSTQSHDRVTKFNLYRRAGVREYWLVDPESRVVQSFILQNGQYVATASSGTDRLSVRVLEGCIIDLGDVFPQE